MTDRFAVRLLPIGVAALTVLAFLPALDAGFVNWDDPANFLNNEGYRGLGWAQIKWMFTAALLGHYIPLTWLTLGVNYVLGGMRPRGYHLGNLLLHAGNAALVYLVARRLLAAGFHRAAGGDASPTALALGAVAASLAFAVHPLRVESVAWVTERRDVLCGGFYLLAVLAYLRGTERGGVVRGWWLAGSLGAFGAALLSKAMAMTLPVTLLLLDVYPLRRRSLGSTVLLREKVPHAIMAGLGAVVAAVAVTTGAGWTGYGAYGPGARVAMVGYSLWFYPWKLLWPEGLSPLYELPPRISFLEPRFLGPVLAVLCVTVVLILARRRLPGGLAAWLHSAVVLAPVGGVVHAGYQLAHDRYSYLSGLGFAILAGAGVSWALRERGHGRLTPWVAKLVIAAAGMVVVGWGVGTWRQSHVWRDSETLWRAAIAGDESCAICHNNLGIAIVRSPTVRDGGRLQEAEAHFRRAIQLRPERPDPYNNLGALLAGQRRHQEAQPALQAFMRLSPGSADGPARVGMLYVDQERYQEALPLLREALRLRPAFPTVQADLGRALNALGLQRAAEGRLAEAEQLFREATEIEANELEALRNLGRVLVERGEPRKAVPVLRRALTLNPRDGPARFWLARAYALIGERDRADAEIALLREIDPALAGQVTTGR